MDWEALSVATDAHFDKPNQCSALKYIMQRRKIWKQKKCKTMSTSVNNQSVQLELKQPHIEGQELALPRTKSTKSARHGRANKNK